MSFSIMTADLFISLSNSIKYIHKHIHREREREREREHVIKSIQIKNTEKPKNSARKWRLKK